jgi:putative FmdB family regulatory protein
MPTYEYECTKCKKRFEIQQRISEPPKKKCPTCGAKVVRLISGGIGIILKGSGFYTTDYRSAEYKKSAEADRPPGESPKVDMSKPKKRPKKKKD